MDFKSGEVVIVAYPGCDEIHKLGWVQYLCSDGYEQMYGWRKNMFRYCVRFEDGTVDNYVPSTWIYRKCVQKE